MAAALSYFFSLLFVTEAGLASEVKQVPLSGGARVEKKTSLGSFDSSRFADRLRALKFSCTEKSPGVSFVCRGKLEGYPEPVRIYIPSSYREDSSRLALHFHGNNPAKSPRDNSVHFIDGRADFEQWLSDSGSDYFLVVPESIGATNTYDSLFSSRSPKESARNFDHFIDGIEELKGGRIEEISLSAHSGGYRAIGALGQIESIRLSQVDSVGLFDSVYGRSSQLVSWIAKLRARRGVAFVLYVENGTTLRSGPGDQRELNSYLAKEKVFPQEFRAGERRQSVALLATKSEHMDVLKDKRYTEFLRAVNFNRGTK